MSRAYLVAYLNAEKSTIDRVGIFSEPCPTTSFDIQPVVLVEEEGDSYDDACRKLYEEIRKPESWYHRWFQHVPPHDHWQEAGEEDDSKFQSLGLPAFDSICNGFPRGGLSIIYGPDLDPRNEIGYQLLHHVQRGDPANVNAIILNDFSYENLVPIITNQINAGVRTVIFSPKRGEEQKWSSGMKELLKLASTHNLALVANLGADASGSILGSLAWGFHSTLTLGVRHHPFKTNTLTLTFEKVRSSLVGQEIEINRLDSRWPSGTRKLA